MLTVVALVHNVYLCQEKQYGQKQRDFSVWVIFEASAALPFALDMGHF